MCSNERFKDAPLIKQVLQASESFMRSNECFKDAPLVKQTAAPILWSSS